MRKHARTIPYLRRQLDELGRIAVQQGQAVHAIVAAEANGRTLPADMMLDLGRSAILRGDTRNVIASSRHLGITISDGTYHQLADTAFKRSDFRNAIEAYREMTTRAPIQRVIATGKEACRCDIRTAIDAFALALELARRT